MSNSRRKRARPAIQLSEVAPSPAEALAPPPTDGAALPESAAVQAEIARAFEPPLTETAPPAAEPAPAVEAALPAATPVASAEPAPAVEAALPPASEARAAVAETDPAASLEAGYDALAAFNVKAIEAMQAGADANFDLLKAFATAKSLSQLVTLQTEFVRARFEDSSARAKELAKLAQETANPPAPASKARKNAG